LYDNPYLHQSPVISCPLGPPPPILPCIHSTLNQISSFLPPQIQPDVSSLPFQPSAPVQQCVYDVNSPSLNAPSSTFTTLPVVSSIPFLRSRQDFFAWDQAICTLLRALGLYGHIVDPSSPFCLQPSSPDLFPTIKLLLSQPLTSSESAALNLWVANENVVQYIITSRLGASPHQLLPSAHNDRTAVSLYKTLSKHFGLQNFSRSHDFANSLLSSTCNPDRVMDYATCWRAGVMRLKSVNFSHSTRIYIYRFVQGLPL
jgi:hypothetical protein